MCSSDLFRKYNKPLAMAFADLTVGEQWRFAPTVAAMRLQQISEDLGIWDKGPNVSIGFMAEVRRLTNVFVLGANGWETMPLDVAQSRDFFSEDDWEEAVNRIVFFTLGYRMLPRSDREGMLSAALNGWGGRCLPSTATEYRDSLPKPTPVETGESAPEAISVPV